jgi:hypothetical protein
MRDARRTTLALALAVVGAARLLAGGAHGQRVAHVGAVLAALVLETPEVLVSDRRCGWQPLPLVREVVR